ncbi:helix-loop-helix protein delilah-like [Homarus americanus]|uniref:helix-loop-helix protein delilah-like n=1 Tax=Homarus americanus TaxID=6706 RepID=UPI001C463997|nr:helix-loop-helix protein delilah-like [Homarus americanus]
MAKIEKPVRAQEGENDVVDDNNNNNNKEQNDVQNNKTPGTSGLKYQLRPRSVHPRRRCDSEWSIQDTLRHKQRPPPLSRYRRKTANARERYRMRQINTAFESLRGVLPSWVCSRRAASEMTKITTLRLASAYIRSLQDILDGNAHQDTCSWVLSSILQDASNLQEPQPDLCPGSPTKTHQSIAHTSPDSDFVSFLCTSSDSGVFQDSMESLSYLSPMSETEAVALLLGTDPQSRSWTEGHHSPLVS